jgi:hypothetical protein
MGSTGWIEQPANSFFISTIPKTPTVSRMTKSLRFAKTRPARSGSAPMAEGLTGSIAQLEDSSRIGMTRKILTA